jgi:hypothetical protein
MEPACPGAALTCSVAYPARARRRPSRTCRRCGVDRCRRFLFSEFRIPDRGERWSRRW